MEYPWLEIWLWGPRKSSILASEDKRSLKTNDEEQLADGDALWKCFCPLLSSMRVFGLYFTPASSLCVHDFDILRITTETVDLIVSRRKWNKGRIYAVVIWLDTARKKVLAVILTRTSQGLGLGQWVQEPRQGQGVVAKDRDQDLAVSYQWQGPGPSRQQNNVSKKKLYIYRPYETK